MAKLSLEQFHQSLKQPLQSVYLLAGDEALLVQEAAIALRRRADQQGFHEREIFHTDGGFQWPQLLESANAMSLFAQRKLLELRLHNGKVGDAGSKVLKEYCNAPPEDTCLLLLAPRLDKKTLASAWVKAIEACGAVVSIWPVGEKQLPRWLEQRLREAGLRADSEAIEVLAGRIEGNLLAAVQEIEKLKLVCPDGIIDGPTMADAVAESARYNVFTLVDKVLSGDARSAAQCLNGLRSEGTDATLIVWAVSRELRTLIGLNQALEKGQSLERSARQFGVFSARLNLVKYALKRLEPTTLRQALQQCARADRAIKGMAADRPWDLLLEVVLELCGSPALNGETQRMLARARP